MQPTPATGLADTNWAPARAKHIVDQLIDERATNLSRSVLWPLIRPLLLTLYSYDKAVRMADEIAPLSGRDAFAYLSRLLALDVSVIGLENVPRSGCFIVALSHPTGIADGIAIYDTLLPVRPDMAVFANRDALRVAPGFADLIIPVEWRHGVKTHAKARDTLVATSRAFSEGKAVVLFPSGRIAFWNDGRLTERPWQSSIVSLAQRFNVPVIPANITSRNSGLFYFVSKYSTDLRDMTIFHELLNKKGKPFRITFGQPIQPGALYGDPAEVTTRLQDFVVDTLAQNPNAVFAPAGEPAPVTNSAG